MIMDKTRLLPAFLLPALFFIFVGFAICILVYLTKTGPREGAAPLTQVEHDLIRGLFSALTALGLVVVLVVRKLKNQRVKRFLRPTMKGAAALLVAGACVMYFYTARGATRRHYLNFHDLFHYFLGCKYYPEVGYNDFYSCVLQADAEKKRPRWRDNMKSRDLVTYKRSTVAKVREQSDCSMFSEERREEFRKDTDLFSRYSPRGAIADQGYNGAPFSAYVASWVANIPELDYQNLTLLTFVDLMGLSLMFAVLVWGFGWRVAFLAALFHTVNFADFFYHVSFFRYWWMVTLGIGLACLYRRKYGPSAVFLTVSAMLNVFPVLFFAGIALKLLVSLITERTLKPHYKTFVAWAVAATIVCGAISCLNSRPLERYQTFFSNMGTHSALLGDRRTGFKYNFFFRGEFTKDSPRVSYRDKDRDLKRYGVPYFVLVGLILAFGAFVVLRLDDFRATVLAGFLLFFMLFSTVVYYYCVASILVLFWAEDINRKRGVVFVGLLFLMMSLLYIAWWVFQHKVFVVNTVLTGLFTIYLASIVTYFGVETLGARVRSKQSSR